MVILHIAPINMSIANGIRFSVPGLTSAQNKLEGITAGLLNIRSSVKLNREEVENFDFPFFEEFIEIDKLPTPFNKPHIVIFHGVYMREYINIYRKIVQLNIPYIIVPRVSLTEGAQKQKKLKKKLGNILFFNNFIYNASRIHYLTKNEKEMSKRFKIDSFVIGNGIKMPDIKETRASRNINITFIGRYDLHQKGLDILIRAIIIIKEELTDKGVNINFYGSDFRDGIAYINNQIEQNKIHEVLKVHDAVYGFEKHLVLIGSDLFISTSRFEGHPMAVIEAMAYGLPCILTEGTNMLDDLIAYDAGWATGINPNDISKTILLALEEFNKYPEKGHNARRLIEENYTWDIIANKTTENYRHILK